MNETESLITAALMTKQADTPDWAQTIGQGARKVLSTPLGQYTLGGAAAGGAASLLRNMIAKPDPGMEGSALSRFLRSTALGGLAGAGISGGAGLMGFDLPTYRPGAEDKKRTIPGLMQAAGAGVPVGLGALATALFLRRRRLNQALSSRIGGSAGLLKKLQGVSQKLDPADAKHMQWIIRRVSDSPRGFMTVGGIPQAIPRRMLPNTTQGIWPALGTGRALPGFSRLQALRGKVTGTSPQLMMLRRIIRRTGGTASQRAREALTKEQDAAKKLLPKLLATRASDKGIGALPGLSSPSFLGGTGLGALYSLLFGQAD